MEDSNYKSIHIISEAIIVGGLSIYVYKKMSELESTVEELKQQVAMQNNQLRYLLSFAPQSGRMSTSDLRTAQRDGALLHPLSGPLVREPRGRRPLDEDARCASEDPSVRPLAEDAQAPAPSERFPSSTKPKMECSGGVCTLVRDPRLSHEADKKVVISKISKQIEFDRENNDLDQSSKVNTFTKFSPNPVIKSVTPKPSITAESDEVNELDIILNEIDNE